MSAAELVPATAEPGVPFRDLRVLAPTFAARLAHGLNECRWQGLDAVVFEAARGTARQAWLYAQGRTRPGAVVTNAATAEASWHRYGLAVDVVSAAKLWSTAPGWRAEVARILKAAGLDWGGDWPHPDLPHFQFAGMKSSPSQLSRDAFARGGAPAVWALVGAT